MVRVVHRHQSPKTLRYHVTVSHNGERFGFSHRQWLDYTDAKKAGHGPTYLDYGERLGLDFTSCTQDFDDYDETAIQ